MDFAMIVEVQDSQGKTLNYQLATYAVTPDSLVQQQSSVDLTGTSIALRAAYNGSAFKGFVVLQDTVGQTGSLDFIWYDESLKSVFSKTLNYDQIIPSFKT